MKVLQINTVCGNGSVGRITVDISHALEKSGDECLIAYGRRKAPEGVNAWRFGTDLDMGFHVLHTFLKGEHGFASGKQTKKLIEKIKTYDPDVIHLHNIHGFYLDTEQLFDYLRRAGKPVVWTLHDCWPFTGHCAYFDYAGCDKWKEQCETCPLHRSAYPYALFKDNSRGNYIRKKKMLKDRPIPGLTIVTPSRWLADLVQESFLQEYPVRVIHNGIDLSRFRPDVSGQGALRKELGLEDKYVILGVANMWEERKGYPYFLKLAEELGEDFRVILIGLDKKKLKSLPSNIIGLSRTDSVEELARYYAMADVYVNATLEDNFPTTNLEALACGTPVITFATGGSVESVDETTGRIVPKGDLEGLKKAILDVKAHEILPEICREKALQYDKYHRFAEYVSLYRELKEQV
ncbi:MAG: glycosyltransferase [Lachnospiraceae bacterium]|nr:glycosyltransferase [Lachnospiraceae bacterium]